ncbi:hypothetical protein JX265_011340 [Neoarthrinium moseri]|uniref:Mannosyl-oligosaccharide glucosidase n=1 Tax=Neoarthrinium moseri TaxID=1658444 RepID=A0A9P9WCW1_9PEZI|nr:hypothetical protein JX265_011340 [Neoarthrinium moseri]
MTFFTAWWRLTLGILIVAVTAHATVQDASDHSLRTTKSATTGSAWGPYRPNLYFGVRPQLPETLLFGLMWASGDSRDALRDTCEQDDGMQGYGWTSYDPRAGGSQTIHDAALRVDLKVDFYKSQDGLSWTARVTGTPRAGAPADLKTAVVFHAAMERAESPTSERSLRCVRHLRHRDDIRCMALLPELDPVGLYITRGTDNKVVEGPSVMSLNVTEDQIWQAKDHMVDLMDGHSSAAFSTRVDAVFPRAAPFEDQKYAGLTQSLLANLLGGMGYFHGDQLIDYSHAPEYEETDLGFWEKAADAMAHAPVTIKPNVSLLSFVPSRPFFPRGFLWDEGFHLLPVIEWDLTLAVEVLKSWLSLMDDDGWIAREQILGPEARSKVPIEFQTQYPHHANPPTLLMLVSVIISKLAHATPYNGDSSDSITSAEKGQALVKEIFPLLSRHHDWFRRTQAGNFTAYPRPSGANAEGYRWRGRNPGHCLGSGLDDYPRAEPPHPGELHVDALAWVGASAKALQQAAEYIGEDSSICKEQLQAVRQNLDTLHWDPATETYCDATIGHDGKYKHVCHTGYVSLMPLLLGHLDESHPHLPAVLDTLSNPAKLWSPHGLRSLSAQDDNYGKDEDYWRGAVWMNINVLAVLGLRNLGNSTAAGARAQSLAAHLRKRLVDTVYDSWDQTGFAWEQYSDTTGKGQRSRAFTGWTAAVLLLMGLEDAAVTFPDPLEGSTTHSSGWTAPTIGFVGLLVLLVLLRHRIMGLCSRVAIVWRQSRSHRYHQGDEGRALNEAIDLDDLYESDSNTADT